MVVVVAVAVAEVVEVVMVRGITDMRYKVELLCLCPSGFARNTALSQLSDTKAATHN